MIDKDWQVPRTFKMKNSGIASNQFPQFKDIFCHILSYFSVLFDLIIDSSNIFKNIIYKY